MTTQERIHEACTLGKYQTLPFICVASGAQPSVIVKEVLDNHWLGVCRGIGAIVVVPDRAFRDNSYDGATEHVMDFYGMEDDHLAQDSADTNPYYLVSRHLEWFLTQYTADLLLGGAESKRYNGWGKLDKYEELDIRSRLGPGYPKRVLGLDSKLKIQYGRR